jgi:serine/threonine protein kinase/WD40 repeat protein
MHIALPDIPGYELLYELGRGGMGVVYQARQVSLGRIVALKMILAGHYAETEQRTRFRAEARAAARLQHPNIVQIFEVGEHNGFPFFSMEYVGGGSLAQALGGTPQPVRPSAELVTNLARAIHYAHDQGVVHRDMKPANILLAIQTPHSRLLSPEYRGEGGSAGRQEITDSRNEPNAGLLSTDYCVLSTTAKITDFGLAKLLQDDPGVTARGGKTESGAILGTPSYMAPEQAGGPIKAIGPATDVYALGAILYELLTGRPPFKAATAFGTLQQVIFEEPVSVSRLQPAVPRDLETICQKCLQKDPAKRYPSARALADDVDRFLADKPIAARRTGRVERTWRWCRRNPVVAGLSLGLAVMAILVCGGSVLAVLRLGRAAEQARRAERDTQEQLFESLLVQVHASRTGQQPGQRLDSLKALGHATQLGRTLKRDPVDLLKLRNEAIACLALPDLQVETQWEGNLPGTNGIGFDAPFERYAWSFQDEGIRVRRLADHLEQCRVPTPRSDRVSRWVLLGFSPNGRYLAAYYVQWAEKHPLEVWELGDGAGRRVLAIPDATALPAFAADGRSLVAPLPKGEAAIIELPSGVERRRLASGGPAEAVALHPGGKLLAAAGGQSDGVRVLDLEKGSVTHRLPHPDTVQGLAWSADGKMLATACNDLLIHLWETGRWQKKGELTGHRFEVGDVAFDPTGRWLASFGWDMTLRVWEVGSQRQVLNVEDIRVLGFRSKGQLAAAGVTGQRVQVWGFRPSEVFHELHPFETGHAFLQLSPDGRWLTMMVGAEADLRIWDMRTCRQVYRHLGRRGGFSPDWTWFLSLGADGISRVPVSFFGPEEPPAIRFDQARRLVGLPEDVRDHSISWVGERRLVLVDPPGIRSRPSRIRLLELNADTIRVIWERRKPNASLSAAVSRDGRLVAVGSYWGGNGVSVWETDTGRLAGELPTGDAHIAFAADGRHLYTTTGRLSPRGSECRSWWVGSWKPDRALALKRASHRPAGLDVAADGTVSIVFTMNDMRLLNPETFEELATLSAPQPGMLEGGPFSSDGTTLFTTDSGTVQVWNLQAMRRQLATMGLDWTTPASQLDSSQSAAP